MKKIIIDQISNIENTETLLNESLSKHTTYKIGGEAKVFLKVKTLAALSSVLKICKNNNVETFIIGRGSNLLVSDEGFDGVIIYLEGEFKEIIFDSNSNTYTVGCGVLLSKMVSICKRNSHSGFEFAVGTPGTIGGALKMNAGTRTDWIGSRVCKVWILDSLGNIIEKYPKDLVWGYRQSSFKDNEIILRCTFMVNPINSEKCDLMIQNMKASLEKRHASQPFNKPSCGSVFRNPDGFSAGKLIQDSGLKGYRIGGAQISDKHANFFINAGGASANDMVALINLAQKTVYKKFNVKLLTEVRFLGFKDKPILF